MLCQFFCCSSKPEQAKSAVPNVDLFTVSIDYDLVGKLLTNSRITSSLDVAHDVSNKNCSCSVRLM